MDPDELRLDRAVSRIFRLMVFLAFAGALAGFALAGWRWALGYLAGAAASFLNFRWLKQLTDSLGEAAAGESHILKGRRPGLARAAVLMTLRYGLLGLGGYAILSYSIVSLRAALAGLFVSAAAVILEILFQLLYARA